MARSGDNDESASDESPSDESPREQTLQSTPIGDTDELVEEIEETGAQPGGSDEETRGQGTGERVRDQGRDQNGATLVISTTTILVLLLLVVLLILIF